MDLFDILNPNFFSHLTGINKHRYADIISLIWERCSQNPVPQKVNRQRKQSIRIIRIG